LIVCDLSQIEACQLELVGSKVSALAQLRQAGFPVPDGLVLTTAAYGEVIAPLTESINARVTADVIMDPAEIETAAQEVRSWIENEVWPDAILRELANALESNWSSNWQSNSYAARTSLPTEELATAFGSGVRRAWIGLLGLNEIQRGAASCWGALWTSRSMYYRHKKKIPQTGVALAVLLQPMIRAVSAGRLFTCGTSGEDRDTLLVETVWGLAEPLTQARVQPDRFHLSKSDYSIRDRQIAEKSVRLVVSSNGRTEQVVVSASDAGRPSLSDEHLNRLARLGTRVESFFGQPQDIEWALEGNEFVILQSRPVALRTS
jgi:rifampicin phosphotransferase